MADAERATPANDRDLGLVRAAAAGDPAAQRAIVERLLERTRATVRYLAGDHPDADDLVQLGLIQVLESAPSFRGESSLETWADRIVIRTALRELKRLRLRGRLVEVVADAGADEPTGGQEPLLHPEREVARHQLAESLARLLDRLPDKQRTVVVLGLVHGLRNEEIAELVGAPGNTVAERLRVGRKKLRQAIAKNPAFREWVAKR